MTCLPSPQYHRYDNISLLPILSIGLLHYLYSGTNLSPYESMNQQSGDHTLFGYIITYSMLCNGVHLMCTCYLPNTPCIIMYLPSAHLVDIQTPSGNLTLKSNCCHISLYCRYVLSTYTIYPPPSHLLYAQPRWMICFIRAHSPL